MRIARTQNTIRNIFWGYISKIAGILMPFFLRTTVIYVFGAQYVGINSLFTSILQVLSLSELGFGSAMVYSMYKPVAENNVPAICALLNLYKRIYRIIGLVMLGVGTVIMPFIPKLIQDTYPSEINIYFVYYLFLLNTALSYFLYAYKTSLFSAFQRNDLEGKTGTIITIFQNMVEIIIIIIFKKYYFYLYIMVFFAILRNLLNLWFANKYFPEYKCEGEVSDEEKQGIKRNVVALMCHKIGGTILNSADNIIISAFLGLIILAKYTNYYYVMQSVESVVFICFTGMTAGIGNSFILESVEKNRDNFRKVLFFNAGIVVVFGTMMVTAWDTFIKIWVGDEYLFPSYISVLMLVYFYIHSIRRTIIVFRDGAGMWWDNKWQPIVSGGFNLIVNIILVVNFGVQGVIISTIVSMILIDIPWETKAFCMKKLEMRDSEYYKLLLKYFLCLVIACVLSDAIVRYIPYMGVISLIMELIIAAVISILTFGLMFHSWGEFEYFMSLIKKLCKR